jgi:hypothetical protein
MENNGNFHDELERDYLSSSSSECQDINAAERRIGSQSVYLDRLEGVLALLS